MGYLLEGTGEKEVELVHQGRYYGQEAHNYYNGANTVDNYNRKSTIFYIAAQPIHRVDEKI
jgi:hypothetical protein